MYPELFGVIKSYGLMLAISFAVGMWLSVRRGKPEGIPSETILDLVFGVLVSSIVGVRLFFVMTHAGSFDPWYRAFFIWDGGLTLYGGIILATATVWWMTRRRGIPFMVIADNFSPGVLLGIGLTRLGCFMAGCCYGLPTDHACGVSFPAGSDPWLQFGGLTVHPTQLYASALGFLGTGLLIFLERWPAPRGATFGRFLVFYGVARFIEDMFRWYESEQILMWGWSNNQWISVALVLGGLFVLVLGHRGLFGRRETS
jgi:phosphatidylglycerol:prolipoprotein diacylglycerol transferase